MALLMRFFCSVLLSLSTVSLFAQSDRDWTVELKCPQVFIENQGQYDEAVPALGSAVRYAVDHGFGWQVFFAPNRVAYKIQRCEPRRELNEREKYAANEAEEEKDRKIQSTLIQLEWVGGNTAADMQVEAPTPDYYTWSYEHNGEWVNLDHVNAYQHLRVAQLYPGVDMHFEAPGDRGIKYSLHLAPGVNPAIIRQRWSGSTPSLDAEGNIHLPAVLGELVDHAPRAWYADDESHTIPCAFVLNGNEVSYQLGTYDASRAIVIDPWTVNPALPAPFNRAFEVDADAAGNVIVWGGGMGYNVKKYNPAGTLQWTHVSPWDTSNAWFGELLVRDAGNMYISSGSVAKLRQLTAAGATVFTNNGPFINNDEYWTMIQNCDKTKLIIGGTRLVSFAPRSYLFDVNLANGNQIAPSPYRIQTGCGCSIIFATNCETRMLSQGSDGYMYALTHDSIYKLNTTFGRVWGVPHGKVLGYYSPSYMAQSVQGINGLDASSTHFYINWGSTVERWSNATGTLVNSAPVIHGAYSNGCLLGTGPDNNGLVLDNCGNVFVGSDSAVYKYSSTLVLLDSVVTPANIYDLHVATGGVVIIGGNAFLSSNTSLAACGPKTITCPVLSVELSSFTGQCQGQLASLFWETSEESGNSHFAIMRSTDGVNWINRGQVSALGDSDLAHRYHFEDELDAFQGQTWFYRLQMVDINGVEEQSSLLTLTACDEPSEAYSVFPSVNKGDFSVEFVSESSQPVRVEVLNAEGKSLRQFQVNAAAGFNHVNLQADLASGLYWVKVSGSAAEIAGQPARIMVAR